MGDHAVEIARPPHRLRQFGPDRAAVERVGTVNLRSCGRSANRRSPYVTRDLVNRRGEPAKIALGLLKLTVPRRHRHKRQPPRRILRR